MIAPEVRFLMRRRIAALFFALIYFQTNVCQAFVPVTPVGAEIAQVLASRGAVTGLSRVFAGLGPWGILASVLIPVVYGWVTQGLDTLDGMAQRALTGGMGGGVAP